MNRVVLMNAIARLCIVTVLIGRVLKFLVSYSASSNRLAKRLCETVQPLRRRCEAHATLQNASLRRARTLLFFQDALGAQRLVP